MHLACALSVQELGKIHMDNLIRLSYVDIWLDGVKLEDWNDENPRGY